MATRTRNRTSRLAVLDTSVRRPTSSPLTSRSRSPYRRRIVVVGLAVLSLALITISFRETSSGPAHGFQSVGATVLRPFEIAADRVARPFQDAYNWVHGLATAHNENKKLRAEVQDLRQRDEDESGEDDPPAEHACRASRDLGGSDRTPSRRTERRDPN